MHSGSQIPPKTQGKPDIFDTRTRLLLPEPITIIYRNKSAVCLLYFSPRQTYCGQGRYSSRGSHCLRRCQRIFYSFQHQHAWVKSLPSLCRSLGNKQASESSGSWNLFLLISMFLGSYSNLSSSRKKYSSRLHRQVFKKKLFYFFHNVISKFFKKDVNLMSQLNVPDVYFWLWEPWRKNPGHGIAIIKDLHCS